MANTTHSNLVNVFYNTHPISESQVLNKLEQTGADTSILTVELLQHHDQDHFGGLAATDALARHAKINESTHVLDLCCGSDTTIVSIETLTTTYFSRQKFKEA